MHMNDRKNCKRQALETVGKNVEQLTESEGESHGKEGEGR